MRLAPVSTALVRVAWRRLAPLKSALQVDLYFGRTTDKGREITEAEWAGFLTEEVTPRRYPMPVALERVERLGDLFEPVLHGRQALAAALRELRRTA